MKGGYLPGSAHGSFGSLFSGGEITTFHGLVTAAGCSEGGIATCG